MIKLNLNENFISRIWENKSYYDNLETIDGQKIKVISTGIRNKDEGPDYTNATIKINNYLYTGDVEIHKTLKDWFNHKHKNRGKYDKVILQIVMWDSDIEDRYIAEYKNFKKIPTVILSKYLTKSIHAIWREIIDNPSKEFRIPCYEDNKKIEADKKIYILENIGLKRFHYRAKRIRDRYETLNNKLVNNTIWKQLLMEFVFEALGFSKNKNQFLKLAKYILLDEIIDKNFSEIEISALLYGTAGFLSNNNFKDEYPKTLKHIWENKLKEYNHNIMDFSEWNFFRLRPLNFPTLRIAYASGFINSIINDNFFEKLVICFIRKTNLIKNLSSLFQNVRIDSYWNYNYNFDKPSKIKINPIGKQRINDIIVNVVMPLIFQYSLFQPNEEVCNLILEIYCKMKEMSKNEISKAMEKQLHIKIKKVVESQGAIHLHNFYCVKGKCDFCNIGKNLFVKEKEIDYLKIILY
ncbi:MAG: DUF2851 family protein [Ignavibacteria bacterium]|nr:DUF2851 family protein [Ignavibacteria bacterium]